MRLVGSALVAKSTTLILMVMEWARDPAVLVSVTEYEPAEVALTVRLVETC